MKKSLLLALLFTLMVAPALYAQELDEDEFDFPEGTELNFKVSEEGKMDPSVKFPIYWGEKYYSLIAVETVATSEVKKMDDIDEKSNFYSGDNTMIIDITPWGIRDNFSDYNYHLGINYRYAQAEMVNIGYVQFTTLPPPYDDMVLAFDDKTTLTLQFLFLSADIGYTTDEYFLKFTCLFAPVYQLELKQKTLMKPFVANVYDFHKTYIVNSPMYTLRADAGYKPNRYFGFKVFLEYGFFPLEYDVLGLVGDMSTATFNFVSQKVDTEETTITYGAQAFIPFISISGLSPTVGYEVSESKVKDNINGGSQKNKESKYRFGLTYNW